jgi:tRNA-specific 2-thiouridylase
MGEPYFVVQIVPESRQVVIGPKASLYQQRFVANEANWLIPCSELPARVSVQIRYNGQPKPATVSIDSDDPDRFSVEFDEPQLAVAPGQAAVVYDGTRVLGGGWIL